MNKKEEKKHNLNMGYNIVFNWRDKPNKCQMAQNNLKTKKKQINKSSNVYSELGTMTK